MATTVPVGRDHVALVDDEDFERVSQYRWHYQTGKRCGYAHAFIEGKTIGMHRFILDAPKGKEVAHRNHDKLDNRRANLDIVTTQQNQQHRRGAQENNRTSGVRGISWCAKDKVWLVQIGPKSCRYRGRFKSLDAAIEQVEIMREELRYYNGGSPN